MFEKDYLTRLFITLTNALNKIKNSIDKDHIEGAKIQISDAYQLLGNDSSFFLTTEIDEILLFFKEKEGGYLMIIQLLGELIYQDSLVQEKKETKKMILEKSI